MQTDQGPEETESPKESECEKEVPTGKFPSCLLKKYLKIKFPEKLKRRRGRPRKYPPTLSQIRSPDTDTLDGKSFCLYFAI